MECLAGECLYRAVILTGAAAWLADRAFEAGADDVMYSLVNPLAGPLAALLGAVSGAAASGPLAAAVGPWLAPDSPLLSPVVEVATPDACKWAVAAAMAAWSAGSVLRRLVRGT